MVVVVCLDASMSCSVHPQRKSRTEKGKKRVVHVCAVRGEPTSFTFFSPPLVMCASSGHYFRADCDCPVCECACASSVSIAFVSSRVGYNNWEEGGSVFFCAMKRLCIFCAPARCW